MTAPLLQFDHKRFWRDAVQSFAEWYYKPVYVPLGNTSFVPVPIFRADPTRPPNPQPLTGSISYSVGNVERIAIVNVGGFLINITPHALAEAERKLPSGEYQHLREFTLRKAHSGPCPDIWESRYKRQRLALEALLQLVLGH